MAYSVKEAKELVLKAGLELCEAGLVARTWGNISARVSDTQYVITPSGRAYDTLTAEDIVLVNIADGSYVGDVKPSGEKGVHAAVYELCPKMDFVIHTHQNYASALSVLGKEIAITDDYSKKEKDDFNRKETKDRAEEDIQKNAAGLLGDTLPCADYGMYATETLVNNIKKQIAAHPESKAVLMKYHGALCFGKDYEEAFAVAYELEKVSENVFVKLCGEKNIGKKDIPAADNGGCIATEAGNEDFIKRINTANIPPGLQHQLQSGDGIQSVLLAQTPYIVKMSNFGKTMEPYLDDAAQIAGVDVKCVDILGCACGQVCADEKFLEEGFAKETQTILDALADRNAVLLKGIGALCTGVDESEAGAVAIVLEKACMAAYLAECVGEIPALDKESAQKDREGYVNHYSKLK